MGIRPPGVYQMYQRMRDRQILYDVSCAEIVRRKRVYRDPNVTAHVKCAEFLDGVEMFKTHDLT